MISTDAEYSVLRGSGSVVLARVPANVTVTDSAKKRTTQLATRKDERDVVPTTATGKGNEKHALFTALVLSI